MVKVIMGVKGTGKTKQMIEMINAAVTTENGNVIAIERGPKLTYDLSYRTRLIDTLDYELTTFERMKGFISGLYASNFDITHIFIDSLGKIVPSNSGHDMEAFLDWLESFSEKNGVKFTVTISADASLASDEMKKYF